MSRYAAHPWPEVPVDKTSGRALRYEGYAYGAGVEWKPNWEFEATLRYVGIERGRSAAHFEWRDVSDTSRKETDWLGRPYEHYEQQPYVMFMQQMGEILERDEPITREIRGVWTYVKRGSNYGIRLIRRLGEEA